MSQMILSLRGLCVGFGDKAILDDISFDVPPCTIVGIMGPGGAGKSTLLRAITGANNHDPRFWTEGECRYLGLSGGVGEWPALVMQHPSDLTTPLFEYLASALPERGTLTRKQQLAVYRRLLQSVGREDLAEQTDVIVAEFDAPTRRILSILRAITPGPRLVCVDEPVHELDDPGSLAILRYVRRESRKRSIVLVTHNQRWAREYTDYAGLIAGGRLIEFAESDRFFNEPVSEITRHYLRTGGCAVPSLSAKPDEISEDYIDLLEPPKTRLPRIRARGSDSIPSEAIGPFGFHWVIPGQLGGTPKPGVVRDLKSDIAALNRVGVNHVVCLLEQMVLEAELLESGITAEWFPINDMEAPAVSDAARLCATLEQRFEEGQTVALFCRAGLGRTGTMAAAQMVFRGHKAADAIAQARAIEPRWIQSEVQEAFLEEFADSLSQREVPES